MATLLDLVRARSVVTLVAHWPLGLIRVSDLRDPEAFVQELTDSPHPATRLLHELLRQHHADAYGASMREIGPAAVVALVRALNDLLWKIDFGLALGEQRWTLRGAERVQENRRILNEALGELGQPGGLELHDASYSAEEIRDAFPEHYSGILDLIVCHSIVLAECIKRSHPGCRILANHTYARPLLRLLLYGELIRLLKSVGGDYCDLLIELRDRVAHSTRKP